MGQHVRRHRRQRERDAGSGPAAAPFRSRLVHGDVLRTLRSLPADAGFDEVIADPPYNIGKDFGVVKDRMPLGRYLEWTRAWVGECRRLLAADGVIYIYGFPEILARVAALYPIEEQRWLVWHYTNKAAPASSFWQRSHESILCLWRAGGPRPALEVDRIREPYTSGYRKSLGQKRAATASRFGGARGVETRYRDNGGALPRDVIRIPALAGGAGARERWFICRDCGGGALPPAALKEHRGHRILKHPTQKPLALARRLLRSRIKGPEGKVLVPFAGSGSECVAAQQLGIGYLGVEINREYVGIARKWLAHAAAGAKAGAELGRRPARPPRRA